jgi:hypothetical protein
MRRDAWSLLDRPVSWVSAIEGWGDEMLKRDSRTRVRAATLTILLCAGLSPVIARPVYAQPPCFPSDPVGIGAVPIIYGTAGNDRIRGTNGNDVIHGLGGNDRIVGYGGHDYICGGEGNDLIDGGYGLDFIGNDIAYGGSNDEQGDDDLSGSYDNDYVNGGDNDSDTVNGGYGDDTLLGGAGDDDNVNGNRGNDSLSGGSGLEDECDGGTGTDTHDGTCEDIDDIP